MGDFTKGEVYYHKADGRRLVYLGQQGGYHTNRHEFRFVDYKGNFCRDWFDSDEVGDVPPQPAHKMWSLE